MKAFAVKSFCLQLRITMFMESGGEITRSAGRGRVAVFLDRDGVINRRFPEIVYVAGPEHFDLLPGVVEALSILRELGFLLVVVTNQRGIARGFMTEEDLNQVHEFMKSELGKSHVFLDAVYFCPHDEDEDCSCRKPKPGMILEAARIMGIDLASSYTVGDSDSDVAAGRTAGTRPVRIGALEDVDADMAFPSLLDFALFLKGQASNHLE